MTGPGEKGLIAKTQGLDLRNIPHHADQRIAPGTEAGGVRDHPAGKIAEFLDGADIETADVETGTQQCPGHRQAHGAATGDADMQPVLPARRRRHNVFSADSSRVKKPSASISVMTWALAGRSVTRHQSITVCPMVSSLPVSIMTLHIRPENSSGANR